LRLVPRRVRLVMVRSIFTSGDVVAEKPQFSSLADARAFFDNLGHIDNCEHTFSWSWHIVYTPSKLLSMVIALTMNWLMEK
jgi:hypothetical protein